MAPTGAPSGVGKEALNHHRPDTQDDEIQVRGEPEDETTALLQPLWDDDFPPHCDQALRERVQRLRYMSHILDDAITVPYLNRRVGLDPIIGLVPVAGDYVGLFIGTSVILLAAHYHLPKRAIFRMCFHQATDCVVGCIPFVGDMFDFAHKANRKNLKLIEEHLLHPDGARKGDNCFLAQLVLIACLMVAFTVLVIAASFGITVYVMSAVWHWLFPQLASIAASHQTALAGM